MKTFQDIVNLKDKKVLLRVDFDVPVSDRGKIEESFRIRKQKETLDYLIGQGSKVIMVAHISDQSVDQSFAALIPQLHILLGYEVNFIKSVEDIEQYLQDYSGPALLENIRQFKGETENSEEFASSLSKGFDIYVINVFAVCHRNHASVSAITKFLTSYAGFLIEEEVTKLQKAINAPKNGKLLIMGGAKASTKIPVIKNFLDKVDRILIGGVISNDIMKAKGQDVGDSVVDENSLEILVGLDLNSPQLVMPKDYNIFQNKILDIGPESIEEFSEIIRSAKMIIWNGPMGMFENDKFVEGTRAIAQAIIDSEAFKIMGGGDTVAAVDKFGMIDKFDPSASLGQAFISTGGGAMLAFLAGEKLPGLDA